MRHRTRFTGLATAAVVVGLPLAPLGAQAGGPGFSFRQPRGSLSIRGGLAGATAGGDLFGFATDTLTLSRGDFAGPSLVAEAAFGRPGGRLEAVASLGWATASAPSEFRNWVGEDDQPIAQTTSFKRVPVTLGLRAYVLPRGRAIGRFAWVPSRLAPYVGAGVGATWYRFKQFGEFVDYETLDVFRGEFESSGWGATAYGGAGLDVSLTPVAALTVDARYLASRAAVGGDFEGFGDIDLSGLATTVGFTFRF